MINLRHHPQTGQLYLTIRNDFAKAWIEHYPRLGDQLEHLGEIPDWRLWVALPGRPANRQKSPTRLLIESRLRAWVLRRSGRCLPTLVFAELVQLAEGKPVSAAPRVYHGRDESYARWKSGSFGKTVATLPRNRLIIHENSGEYRANPDL